LTSPAGDINLSGFHTHSGVSIRVRSDRLLLAEKSFAAIAGGARLLATAH
jgi:hypothetical protein